MILENKLKKQNPKFKEWPENMEGKSEFSNFVTS